MKNKGHEKFLEEMKSIFGDTFDFSKFVYINGRTKGIVICPTHGEFLKLPKKLSLGSGCPYCSGYEMDLNGFIKKAKSIHGEKYNYEDVNYINSRTKINIICPEHGKFSMTPANHLMGQSCKLCNHVKYKFLYSKNLEDFISESNIIHNNYYDYSKTEYISNKIKVEIICPIHGTFWQEPHNHLRGKGCKECGSIKGSIIRRSSQDTVIEQFRNKHGNKYDYSEVSYIGSFIPVKIKCNIHGIFESLPNHHIQGTGCPSCSKIESKWELEIKDFITSLGVNVRKNKSIINPYEIDLLVENKQIAFECNGLYFHSELNGKTSTYHLNKTNKCKEKGIQLYHIFEDEWHNKSYIVKSFIKNKLGVIANSNKIYARKCIIKEVSVEEKNIFLDANHIQGTANSNIRLGLYYENELVSIMTFLKDKNYEWELNRFCSKVDYIVPGSASKLFKYFIEKYNPNSIVSRADIRFSNGNVYNTLNFKHINNSAPSYYYTDYKNKWHKRGFQHRQLQKKLDFYNEELSEWENMRNNGYDRIWDCGTMKFLWSK